MKRLTFLFFSFILTSSLAFAQTANVQVIHNSPDAAAASVDIYLNGTLAVPGFEFREATEFLPLPAGVVLNIGVAPAGLTVNDTVANFAVGPLTAGENYVVVANGIVNAANYSPAPAFNLDVFTPALLEAPDTNTVSVLVHHGSTDAPTVNVVETQVGAGTVVSNLSYGDFDGYLPLVLDDYIIELQTTTGDAIASWGVPLEFLELGGSALTVVASGFVDPSVNSNGPAFGLFVALPAGGQLIELPLIGNARAQFIHNSPDSNISELGLFINGDLVKADFDFRTATPYVDVVAGFPVNVGLDLNGDGMEDASLGFGILEEGTYNFMFTGVLNPADFPSNPNGIGTGLDVLGINFFENAQAPDLIDFVTYHGAIDAPGVDVSVRGLGVIDAGLEYTDYSSNIHTVNDERYFVELYLEGTNDLVAKYNVDLTGAGGLTAIVFASGLISDGSFGLFGALSNGTVVEFDALGSASAQIIHNSPDAAAEAVDIYVNNILVRENLEFRNSTPFLDFDTGIDSEVGIAPAGSTGPGDIIGTFNLGELTEGESYIVVANGILSPSGYDPSPPLELHVYTGAQQSSIDPSEVDVLVYHGATDAPAVDVAEVGVGAGVVVNAIEYSEFQGYLNLAAEDYILEIRPAGTTDGLVSYSAPLDALNQAGNALTVVASGFLNPEANSDGPAFGLWVSLASGGELIPLPLFTSVEESMVVYEGLNVYPNPVSSIVNVEFTIEKSSDLAFRIIDMNGRTVMINDSKSFVEGKHNHQMNVNQLATGQYYLNIFNAEGVMILKPISITR
ncbi:MAG: DUF4397 domain-containing protein [Chitinophagaceae bacterium]|nr:MAG: DUF4397 domain-containing protein [Chitinophagaceae bacterium]